MKSEALNFQQPLLNIKLQTIKYLLCVIVGCFSFTQLAAQEFGGNPYSIKWRKVQGAASKVIYPVGLDSIAKQVAQSVEATAHVYNGSLGRKIKQIPIVLQNQPMISNAYVSLAPWRSEFYMMPMQDALILGSTDWINNLAVHEYRHVHQYSNFKKGLSKWMYLFAGQEGQALANAMAIPDWFFEGDAVFHETELLEQGRGRLPSFFDPYRSLWMANKKYSYQKLRNGSMKDFVLDHYALGYLLVSYGNQKYGKEFWGKVTDDAARFRSPIYPFQAAVKRFTGTSFRKFTSQAFESAQSTLVDELRRQEEYPVTHPNQHLLRNYQFPVYAGMDSIIALKQSNNKNAAWVLLMHGKEISIATADIHIDGRFNYRNRNIVYTAINFDPRWNWKQFNNIRLLNIDSKKVTKVTHNGRYFSPDLSHDGSKIIAVHVGLNMLSSLHLLDTSGALLDSISVEGNPFLSYPIFSADDQFVYAIARKGDGENAVLRVNLKTHHQEVVIPYVNAPMSYLRLKGNELLFTSTQYARNELISYHLNYHVYHVLSSEMTSSNAGDISDDQQRFVYSRPTAEGEQLFEKTVERVETRDQLRALEKNTSLRKTTDSIQISDVKNYGRASGLFNFHSWRPSYYTPEWSISFYSQNVLNTLETTVQYFYNQNETSHKIALDLASGAHYPWILAGTDYTYSRSFNMTPNVIRWDEWNSYLGLKLPLNLSGGRHFRFINLSTQVNAAALKYDAFNIPHINNKYVAYMQQGISYAFYNQKATQHIYPHWGLTGTLNNKGAVGNTNAHQFFLSNQIYLPGIGNNHSIVMSFAYQQRDTLREYYFTNNFPMARGYAGVDYPRMWRTGFNYHLPLFYPDWGFGNIVYFMRIRANLFYDAMWQKSLRTGIVTNKRSLGTEIHFDTKWWNQLPFAFGIRYSKLLDQDEMNPQGKQQWEFILPLDILPH